MGIYDIRKKFEEHYYNPLLFQEMKERQIQLDQIRKNINWKEIKGNLVKG